jgi:hypothetical protein
MDSVTNGQRVILRVSETQPHLHAVVREVNGNVVSVYVTPKDDNDDGIREVTLDQIREEHQLPSHKVLP